MKAFRTFSSLIRADFGMVRSYRAKYHGQQIPFSHLPLDAVRRIGFQMMLAIRVMGLVRDLRLPLLPQIASRLIRHIYGAEIHWEARFAGGVAIVHGVGLVVSHSASVGSGSILFHNVTLGESVDPETREQGAPNLGENVHIGPGATLLGPITVGAGTKIMAGAVLDRSVPPYSLVRPAAVAIVERSRSTAPPEGSQSDDGSAS